MIDENEESKERFSCFSEDESSFCNSLERMTQALTNHHALKRLCLKWNGEHIILRLKLDETVEDLRALIQLETDVRPENQKIFGLFTKKNECVANNELIGNLGFKDGQVIKMMGSSDDTIEEIEARAATLYSSIIEDEDSEVISKINLFSSLAQNALMNMIERTTMNIMNSPRPNKKLLVLDLDHTLLDFSRRSTFNSPEDFKRPFMDEFLSVCYKYYDIVIWSQTKWHWVEIKIASMGMTDNPSYSICFVLDRSSMFKIFNGVRSHEVKALGIIWAKFSQWSSANTIHIDDMSKNFAMNPKSGLKCKMFSRKRSSAALDSELAELAAYLESISIHCDDFDTLDHSKWREQLQRLVHKRLHSQNNR